MLKKTLIASAIASLSFGAVAADLVAPTGTDIKYAAEQFGSNASTVVVKGMKATAIASGSAGNIGQDAKADLTFTLKNATFASSVRPSDFGAAGYTVNSIIGGGQVGDNFVTAEVQMAAPATSQSFTLDLRELNAPALAASGATVSFNVAIEAINNPAAGEPLPTGTWATPTSVGMSQDAVTIIADTSSVTGNGLIDIEDNTLLVNDDFIAAIATASVNDLTLVKADGTSLSYMDFSKLTASTVGAFNEGDTATFDNADMTVTGNTAKGELSLTGALNDKEVVYTPKGDENLSPADFTTTFTVTPDKATWKSVSASVVDATSYDGQNFSAVINSVPGSDAADVMSIRMTNKGSVTSTVFVQLQNLDGSTGGTYEFGKVAAGETVTIKASDIEALTGTWEKRVNLNVSASQDFSAFVVLRSNGVATTSEAVDAQ